MSQAIICSNPNSNKKIPNLPHIILTIVGKLLTTQRDDGLCPYKKRMRVIRIISAYNSVFADTKSSMVFFDPK